MALNFQSILSAYGINNQLEVSPFGTGLIHHTYIVGKQPQFILQQFNQHVFKNPSEVYQNVYEANQYLIQNKAPIKLIIQKLTHNKQPFFISENSYWRLFDFEKNSFSNTKVVYASQAYQAANQFGKLTYHLSGIEINKIKHTIPNFHNLEFRYNQFLQALKQSKPNNECKTVIEFYKSQSALLNAYYKITSDNYLPIRIMHNDTKISNVLFHEKTNDAITVVDLDTLMPGYFFNDLGDMIRTYVSTTTEESDNSAPVSMNPEYFKALWHGYKDGLQNSLTQNEQNAAQYAGPILIYMIGLRFITDYLNNNRYFKINYPLHNLSRAINQMQLLQCYYEHKPQLNDILNA
ncbi:MAG: phosphotransferase [Bacteroidia bacterium]|nr:phosphotransferase [Bacteroidia bacterium]HQU99611.1 phosphotransferase [Bacteroidia bacterium]